MEKHHKKRMKKYISWACMVALVAFLAFMPLLAGKKEEVDGPQASILSATAEYQDIESVLIGGGTLTADDPMEITIPSAVKLTEYLVSNGDRVNEGDPIASVDRVSVMTAITQVQETLDYLAEEIESVSGDTASETVTARAGGTVKILYAQEGDDAQKVMLEYGALAVLSLDGLMAVRVERRTELNSGDTVWVTFSDDTEVEGRVETNVDGILTVTIDDDGYTMGDTVKVTTEDGGRIGSGELYIHSRWNAVAYSGTVSAVNVSEGDTVTSGRNLMNLTDTGNTANYYQLTSQHREYEKLMLELFRMYQTETLTAPCDGIVTGVDESGAYLLSDTGTGWTVTFLSNSPNGDDETAYTNFVGQVTTVGIDGIIMNMNPQELQITDYKDLSTVPTDPVLMTEEVIYSDDAPVYELVNGEWTQIDAAAIAAGDILLFAGDAEGCFVWVVRIAHGCPVPEEPELTEPSEPAQPDPTEPVVPTEPEQPSEEVPDTTEPADPEMPSDEMQSSTFPQGVSGFMGGNVQEEAEYELYALDTVTVASVTPQSEMTLEISIDELDISKISVGQSAVITVNALNGESFEGTVTAIGTSGTSDGGNSKFTVKLKLPRSESMLPGMNAAANLPLATAAEVLTVPVAALSENGGETILYTSYDEESGTLGDPVTVTVGVSDEDRAEILSGINAGTEIYYAYYDTLNVSNAVESRRFLFGR